MHVILRLECKIYFAVGVQNLFCGPLGVQNLFCGWSANFSLRERSANFSLRLILRLSD